jgi:hypothetical protein
MNIVAQNRISQDFDDGLFFQRLTLSDVCCGPPAKMADCQLPGAD